jgi:monoamine oxidase
MGAQSKVAVTYDRPFWRKRGLSGQAFSHVGPMIEIHDASYEDPNSTSVYALFGFIGIPYSQRQQITADAMKNACLSQLLILFGKDASEYQHTYIKDWGSDPFIASTQDQTQASTHPQIELTSEQPWLSQIKLHLAASEFAQNEAGYMEGAIIAAENAVEQIVLAGA